MSVKLRLRGRYLFASGKVEVEVLERCDKPSEFGGNENWDATPDGLYFGKESVIALNNQPEVRDLGINKVDNKHDFDLGALGSTGIMSLEAWDKLKTVVLEHNQWIDAGRPGRTK